jgi:hypothetical protein
MKEGTNSLLILYFSWWYGYLPRRLFLAFEASMVSLLDLFSVKILLKTLFAPWKRDLISTDGLSIQEKFQIWMLNLASRFIGFLVKTFVLITFLIVFAVALIVFVGLYCFWFVFPLAIIALIILGLTNLVGTT